MMRHIIVLDVLIFVFLTIIHQKNSYNVDTVWCRIEEKIKGRCRLRDECYNSKATNHSKCSGTNSICCPESLAPKKLCAYFGKSLLNSQNDIATLFTNRMETNNETSLSCANTDIPLIIGGEKANVKEFPYQAAIGYGKTKKSILWHCGGTLISKYYVLSAAHCSKSKLARSEAKWIQIGGINVTDKNEPGKQMFDIVRRIIHPKYKPPAKSYDIMLFKLSSPAVITEYVRPACLNTDDTVNRNRVIATGWGKTNYFNKEGNDVLMKVTLQLISKKDCNKVYENESNSTMPLGLHDSMLCAGTPEGGKDTCQGDSGGPITIGIDEPRCMYMVIGVTSFGRFCGFANSPAIYTRVSYFIPWIISEIGKID